MQVWYVKNPKIDLAIWPNIFFFKEKLLANLAFAWPRRETITRNVSYVLLLGFFVLLVEEQSRLVFVEVVHFPHFRIEDSIFLEAHVQELWQVR
jgi:hypothetical protein